MKRRESVNTFLNTSQTEDEFISNKIREFYLRKNTGLSDLHRRFFSNEDPLNVPKKRIRVLVLGNHSSGKSTFVNWYVQKHVLQTSIAIETRKFVVVRHGKLNDVQRGFNTVKFFPDFSSLTTHFGDSFVRNYLALNIVNSDGNKMFRLVDLIDTPGLLDEEYDGFDMNKVVEWFADHVDVIFVFMDPYIKSTCRRTVEIIKLLFRNPVTSEKVHLFLSKSDEVTNEIERSRVLKQVSDGLSKQLLNRRVKILPIFIPELQLDDGEESYVKIVRRRFFQKQEIPNCINLACEKIEDHVKDNVGNNLSKMGKDVEKIGKKIREVLKDEKKRVVYNRSVMKRKFKNYLLSLFCLILLLLFAFLKGGTFLKFKNLSFQDSLPGIINQIIGFFGYFSSENMEWFQDIFEPYQDFEWIFWVILFFFTFLFFMIGKCLGFKKTLSSSNRTELEEFVLAISEAEGCLDDLNKSYKEERI